MSDHSGANEPKWLDEFEQLANEQLGGGSSCDQVHPIVERWFDHLIENDPPESRDSVAQALACLSTEVLCTIPQPIRDALMQAVAEDDLTLWIEHVLLVGRAFEISLNNGDLDDL